MKHDCCASVQWINNSIEVKYYVTNEALNGQAYVAAMIEGKAKLETKNVSYGWRAAIVSTLILTFYINDIPLSLQELLPGES